MLPTLAFAAALALPASPTVDANDPAYVAETASLILTVADELEGEAPPLRASVLAARHEALADLRGYAAAGIFPHNHEADVAVPIFVDNHGTHCAVAYMILASGERGLARSVAEAHNQIRLPAPEPRVADWAERHGFTLEELSRVQRPGYRPRRGNLATAREPRTPMVDRRQPNRPSNVAQPIGRTDRTRRLLPERKQLPSHLRAQQEKELALKLLDIRVARCGVYLTQRKDVKLSIRVDNEGTAQLVRIASDGIDSATRRCVRAVSLQTRFVALPTKASRHITHRVKLKPLRA